MQQTSQIDFTGAPVIFGRGAVIASIISRADLKIAALAVAAAFAAAEILVPRSGGDALFAVAGEALGGLAAALIWEEMILWRHCSSRQRKNKSIETKPDKNTQPDTEPWAFKAQTIKKDYRMMTFTLAAIFVASTVRQNIDFGAFSTAACLKHVMSFAAIAGALYRAISGVQRWHKVLTGEWKVVDKKPPAIKKRAKTPKQGFFRIFAGSPSL